MKQKSAIDEIIEECQRLGGTIINMPSDTEHDKRANADCCPRCGGKIKYSYLSYSFTCANKCKMDHE